MLKFFRVGAFQVQTLNRFYLRANPDSFELVNHVLNHVHRKRSTFQEMLKFFHVHVFLMRNLKLSHLKMNYNHHELKSYVLNIVH
jgi:hypothetical protein